ncbi:hypothetical protein H0H92_009912 [Tricholoma furcatifolium]|nr:hypothetical protein H0H92_009912 [Tricholoma furcatifolium]
MSAPAVSIPVAPQVPIALEQEGLSIPLQIDSLPSAPSTLAAEFDSSFENPALLEPGPLPSEQCWIESQSPPVEGNLLLNSGSITNSMGSLSARGQSQNLAAHSFPAASPLSSTPLFLPDPDAAEELDTAFVALCPSSPVAPPFTTPVPAPTPAPVPAPMPASGPTTWPRPNSRIPLYADTGLPSGVQTIGNKTLYLDPYPRCQLILKDNGICQRCAINRYPQACWYPQESGACFPCKQVKKQCALGKADPSKIKRWVFDCIWITSLPPHKAKAAAFPRRVKRSAVTAGKRKALSPSPSLIPRHHVKPRLARHLTSSPRPASSQAGPSRLRSPSPQARMAALRSPVARPALTMSALHFFAAPATSPEMFHEERSGLRPRPGHDEDLEE